MGRVRRDEQGLTLVECLVTVSIMGIAFVALLGGLATSIFASDVHRQQATAETVLRSFAEHVKTTAYEPCASPSAYEDGFTPADDDYAASVTAVEPWNAVTATFDAGCGAAGDTGLQRVTLRVTSSSGRATETVQIAKRMP